MLRWYQEEAVNSIFRYFEREKGNPLIAAPGGTGKSHIISGFIQRAFGLFANQRFMILTHVKELIEQDVDKLIKAWPLAPLGVYSASVGRKDTHAPITFGGVASVVRAVELFGHIDLVIVDEAHLISDGEDTMYQQIFAALRKINPYLKVIGLTATPFRLGQGMLTDGKLFTHVCYDITGVEAFNRLINEGYLVPLIPKQTHTHLDVKGVGVTKGDYKQGELQKAVDKNEITYAALQEAMSLGADRKSWLAFSSGIEHAEHIKDMLAMFGVAAACITSETSKNERAEKIKLYKSGYYRCLVGNNIFTTGFDHPPIDFIINLRPTMSPGLWVQMLSRGTRTNPQTGKVNCLVADFARNSKRLGPINDPVIPRPKGHGNGAPPIKTCEHCGVYNHISVRYCIGCGTEFNFAIKFSEVAATDELLKRELPVVETYNVNKVIYNRHHKEGSFPTMEVIYYCNNYLARFREFICFEHKGFPGHKAREWWRLRHWTEPPKTTDEALKYIAELRPPKAISVHVNRQFPDIVSYQWHETSS